MQSRPYFIYFSILAFLINACSSAKECQNFRTGKFKMTYNGHTTIITRSENIQKEVKEGLETVLNVKWIDDCTFTLTPTNDTFRKMPNVPKDAFVTVEITKVNYNSYKQVCTSNFSDNVITGEVFKINE